MLELIRKNASSYLVKGILLIIICAFIGTIGLIWGAGGFSGLTKENIVVTVNKNTISLVDYNKAIENKIRVYRNVYGERFSNKLLERLRVKERTLDELIEKELVSQEAIKHGFEVTDAEVRDIIVSYQAFQQQGIFNANLYRQLLRSNGISVTEFESEQRHDLLTQKMGNLITDRAKVPETEIRMEYEKQNEKIKADYLVLMPQRIKIK